MHSLQLNATVTSEGLCIEYNELQENKWNFRFT